MDQIPGMGSKPSPELFSSHDNLIKDKTAPEAEAAAQADCLQLKELELVETSCRERKTL